MKTVVPGLCLLALFACSPQTPPAPAPEAAATEVFTFACAGGKSFNVSYDAGFTVASVSMDGTTYKLPAAMSASGSRYTDGKVEFWEHQGEAMLSGFAGAPEAPCPMKER